MVDVDTLEVNSSCVSGAVGGSCGRPEAAGRLAGRQHGAGDQGLLTQGRPADSKQHLSTTARDLISAPGLASQPHRLLSCGEGECHDGDGTHLLLIIILWYHGHDSHLMYSDWQQCAKCSADHRMKHGCWLFCSGLKS